AADQAEYGIGLLGGDTIRTVERLVVSITAFGTVPAGRMVRRAGARPGDVVVVTGTIGDSALGVAMRYDPAMPARLAASPASGTFHAGAFTDADRAFLNDRYVLPRPRLAAAE